MTLLLRIICLYTLAKINEIEMITLSNKRVTVTFHDYQRSWNEAEVICENNGGRLFVEDSPERTIVVQEYMANDWTVDDSSWIGLHYPSASSDNVFAWTNCMWIDYDHYKDSAEPKKANDQKCGQQEKGGKGWLAHDCTHSHKFMCEKRHTVDCPFMQRTGVPTKTNDFSKTTITTANKNGCEWKCLITINNNQNCWGLNFYTSGLSNNCVLYFTENPFYFTSSATYDSSSTSMAIKLCYSSDVDSTDDTTVPSDVSKTPTEVCSQYTDQTTALPTTTTTPAPTTTTTTPAPTTTTTTPAPTTTTTTTTAAPTTTTTTTTTTAVPTTTTTTTTAVSTTTGVQTTISNICSCSCSNQSSIIPSSESNPDWANMTTEEKVEYFVIKLRVDKTKLSLTQRKKTSAQDDRAISKSVGYVAIVFMCIVFGLMVLSDGTNFVHYLLKKREGSKDTINSIHVHEYEEDSVL